MILASLFSMSVILAYSTALLQPEPRQSEELTAFLTSAEAISTWASTKVDKDGVQAAEYSRVGEQFQRLSPEDARKAVSILEERAMKKDSVLEQHRALSRIYVLTRYYINVPEFEVESKVKSFGSFDSIPRKPETEAGGGKGVRLLFC
jgi:hypothetical protein